MNTLIHQIENDLGWRERELASLRILLKRNDVSKNQKEALLRASWAMLYAHYEGFVKISLSVYYDSICKNIKIRDKLPENLKLNSLKAEIKNAKQLKDKELFEFIENFRELHLERAPTFSEVETDSNLKSVIFFRLLEDADISDTPFREMERKIDTLVARRNSIAHGEKNIIDEIDYYLGFEDTIYNLMYNLAFQLDEKIAELIKSSQELKQDA